MRVTEPGFYELSEADYFSDPCPQPSLTQSLAKTLIRRSPAHMWWEHPRLNSEYESENNEKFDLGIAAHAILFGRGRPVVIGDFTDYRKKEARIWRDLAYGRGEVPLLKEQHERAVSMVEKFKRDCQIEDGRARKEVVLVAEMKGVWLRTKIDWLSYDGLVVVDYKTTSQIMERSQLHSFAVTSGWHIQAAMHERLLQYLKPLKKGQHRVHYFILQETTAPYSLYRCELGNAMMELGRAQLAEAVSTFKRCLDADQWPGPAEELLIISPPGWAVRQHQEATLGKAEL